MSDWIPCRCGYGAWTTDAFTWPKVGDRTSCAECGATWRAEPGVYYGDLKWVWEHDGPCTAEYAAQEVEWPDYQKGD